MVGQALLVGGALGGVGVDVGLCVGVGRGVRAGASGAGAAAGTDNPLGVSAGDPGVVVGSATGGVTGGMVGMVGPPAGESVFAPPDSPASGLLSEAWRSSDREATSDVRDGCAGAAGTFTANATPVPATSTAAMTRKVARRTGSSRRWEMGPGTGAPLC